METATCWADENGLFLLANNQHGNPGCDACTEEAAVRVRQTYWCLDHAVLTGIPSDTAETTPKPELTCPECRGNILIEAFTGVAYHLETSGNLTDSCPTRTIA